MLEDFTSMQPYKEYSSECSYCRRPHNNGRLVSYTRWIVAGVLLQFTWLCLLAAAMTNRRCHTTDLPRSTFHRRVAYGVHSYRMNVVDYEALLERGYLRSGSHVYQPSNDRSCCPNIPIRLDALAFTPTKSHKQLLKRLSTYLSGKRPINLPEQNTDVFSRCMELTAEGRVSEAADAVVRYRAEGDPAPELSTAASAASATLPTAGAGAGGALNGDGIGTGPAKAVSMRVLPLAERLGMVFLEADHDNDDGDGNVDDAGDDSGNGDDGGGAVSGIDVGDGEGSMNAAAAGGGGGANSDAKRHKRSTSSTAASAASAGAVSVASSTLLIPDSIPIKRPFAHIAPEAVAPCTDPTTITRAYAALILSLLIPAYLDERCVKVHKRWDASTGPAWLLSPPERADKIIQRVVVEAPSSKLLRGRTTSSKAAKEGSGHPDAADRASAAFAAPATTTTSTAPAAGVEAPQSAPLVAVCNAAFVITAEVHSSSDGKANAAARMEFQRMVAAELASYINAHRSNSGGDGGVGADHDITAVATGPGYINLHADVADVTVMQARKDAVTAAMEAGKLSTLSLGSAGAAVSADGAAARHAEQDRRSVSELLSLIPHTLNCTNAKTAAEKRAMRAWYRNQQVQLEASGKLVAKSDFYTLESPVSSDGEEELDADDDNDDEIDNGTGDYGVSEIACPLCTFFNRAGSGTCEMCGSTLPRAAPPPASSAGRPSFAAASLPPSAAEQRRQQRIAQRLAEKARKATVKREVAVQKEIQKSTDALHALMNAGVGARMVQLRQAAEANRAKLLEGNATVAAAQSVTAHDVAVRQPAQAGLIRRPRLPTLPASPPFVPVAETGQVHASASEIASPMDTLSMPEASAPASPDASFPTAGSIPLPSSSTSSAATAASSAPAVPAWASQHQRPPLLPFGLGPHKLTVTLTPCQYSKDANELYARFNLALHRGKPSSQSAASFKRHLIDSPITPTPAWRFGMQWACSNGSTAQQKEEVERLAQQAREWYATHAPTALRPPASASAAAGVDAPRCSGAGTKDGSAGDLTRQFDRTTDAARAASLADSKPFAAGAGAASASGVPEQNGPAAFGDYVEMMTEIAGKLRDMGDPSAHLLQPSDITAAIVASVSDQSTSAAWVAMAFAELMHPVARAEDERQGLIEEARKTNPLQAKTPSTSYASMHCPPVSPSGRIQPLPLPACMVTILSSLHDIAAQARMDPTSILLAVYLCSLQIVNDAALRVREHERYVEAAARYEQQMAEWNAVNQSRDSTVSGVGNADEGDGSGGGHPISASTAAGGTTSMFTEDLDDLLPATSANHGAGDTEGNISVGANEAFLDGDGWDIGDDAGAGNDAASFSTPRPQPPTAPLKPVHDPAWLTDERVLARLSCFVNKSATDISWIPDAVASLLDQIAEVVAIYAEENLKAAQSGSAFVGAGDSSLPASTASPPLPPLPSADLFDRYFVRAPTPGCPRFGALPNPLSPTSCSSASPLRGAAADTTSVPASAPAEPHLPPSSSGVRGADPYPRIAISGWDLPFGYGSFFQEYRLDGTLVAVSLMDILPTRIASVYFWYDPDFRYLQLGKLSALVEIWMVQQIAQFTREHPELSTMLPPSIGPICRHWDPNFYVHSCPQMNYKRQFQPSEVLCPVMGRNAWVRLDDEALIKLDADPLTALSSVVIDYDHVTGEATTSDDSAQVRHVAARMQLIEDDAAFSFAPRVLTELRDGAHHRYGSLNRTTCGVCEVGMRRYLHGIGLGLASRIICEPNGLYSAGSDAKAAVEKKLQKEEQRAARRGAVLRGSRTGGLGGDPGMEAQ